MSRFKKMAALLAAIAALLGCGEKGDSNNIQTIVLDNGKIKRTLKIPAGYIQTKGKGGRTEDAIWIRFIYPSMQPFYWAATPTEDSVALLISLVGDPSEPSRSELILNGIKRTMNNSPDRAPARYLGQSGIYEVYEEEDINTHNVSKTYFTHDQNGNLISFRDPNFRRITGERRYAEVLDLSYVFSRSLQPKQLEIDAAVTKFVDSLLQK